MRRAREQEPNWPSLPPSVPSTCVSRAPARRAQLPAAALLLALLIAPLAPRAAAQTAFTYPNSVCAPASQNADPGRRFVVGETAYLCLNINGRTTAFFNVVVDMFSAIEVQGCAYMAAGGHVRAPVPRPAAHAVKHRRGGAAARRRGYPPAPPPPPSSPLFRRMQGPALPLPSTRLQRTRPFR